MLEDWQPMERWGGGASWALRLSITPPELGTAVPVPATTEWWVTVAPEYPAGDISFLPAIENGLPGFFPHQARDFPDVRDGRPWRGAKICVATNTENNLTNTGEVEPMDAEERLTFQARRAVEWVRRASCGTLLGPGQPFELPVFTMDPTRPTIAFWEGPETLPAWREARHDHGVAELVHVGGRIAGPLAVRRFDTAGGIPVVGPPWGSYVAGAKTAGKAVWIRLPAMPVLPPWEAPITWGQMRAAVSAQGIDLDSILGPAIDVARRQRAKYLLVGFPAQEKVGGAVRMHWQPASLAVKATGHRRRRGGPHRPKTSPWTFDYVVSTGDGSEIRWVWGANWHPDQIGSRGRFPPLLTERRALLLGAGALGATVAEMLARGGVRDLTVIDQDRLEAGNLVRHTLNLDYLGIGKAAALAHYLNRTNPNVTAHGFAARFPDGMSEEATRAVNAADLVIDTTGDEALLGALGMYPWAGRRRFVVLALTYAARQLLAFVADGSAFPSAVYWERVGPWLADQRAGGFEMPHEAIGCWHPVFPARVDDMFLLAATATEALAEWPAAAEPILRVFERSKDADSMPAMSAVNHDGR